MELYLIDSHTQQTAILTDDEARHCTKVMRHQEGDLIMVSDGRGMAWLAIITQTTPQEVTVQLTEPHPQFGEAPVKLDLVFSPLRLKDRMEWMLEKAVELGATNLIPVRCSRTDKYKATLKRSRTENVLRTAAKQCLRSHIPELYAEIPWEVLLSTPAQPDALCLIARADSQIHLQDAVHSARSGMPIRIAVGPEGDFTDEEMDMAQAQGWQPVNLGKQRLRSETAAAFALSVVKMVHRY